MAGIPGTLALFSLPAPTPLYRRVSTRGRRVLAVVTMRWWQMVPVHLAFRASDGPVAYRSHFGNEGKPIPDRSNLRYWSTTRADVRRLVEGGESRDGS